MFSIVFAIVSSNFANSFPDSPPLPPSRRIYSKFEFSPGSCYMQIVIFKEFRYCGTKNLTSSPAFGDFLFDRTVRVRGLTDVQTRETRPTWSCLRHALCKLRKAACTLLSPAPRIKSPIFCIIITQTHNFLIRGHYSKKNFFTPGSTPPAPFSLFKHRKNNREK